MNLPHARHNLAVIAATRRLMVEMLRGHTLAQVNAIPAGFRNNLIWNAAHCWVSLHRVVFLRNGASDQELALMGVPVPDEATREGYRNGTAPTGDVEAAFVDTVCAALSDATWSARLTEEFLVPERYTAWTTMWGVELHDAGEGLAYINMHEGMHYGVMLSIRKLV